MRKHLSAIKGGRLAAAAAPAPVVALLISDVPGDDPSVIASGPDRRRSHDLRRGPRGSRPSTGIELPPAVRAASEAARRRNARSPGDPRLAASRIAMIATPQDALEAAAAVARAAGYRPLILGNAIEGEARDVALVHAGIARQVLRHGQPVGAALRAALRRRDDGDDPRQRAAAGATPSSCWRSRVALDGEPRRLGHRLRYRRHRRHRGQCRRDRSPRYAGARRRGRPRRQGDAGRQRRLRLLRGARRPDRHRSDAAPTSTTSAAVLITG